MLLHLGAQIEQMRRTRMKCFDDDPIDVDASVACKPDLIDLHAAHGVQRDKLVAVDKVSDRDQRFGGACERLDGGALVQYARLRAED